MYRRVWRYQRGNHSSRQFWLAAM